MSTRGRAAPGRRPYLARVQHIVGRDPDRVGDDCKWPGSAGLSAAVLRRPAALLALTIALVTVAAAGCRERRVEKPAPQRPPLAGSVRTTMPALHAAGGVPPRWRFSMPPGDADAGRQLFLDVGCSICHAVKNSGFPPPTGVGPELTGMGTHHPPGYFAESIQNPDAILVDGPGYLGPDGRSIMPMYPDLTLGQLTDLVAYLRSLSADDPHPQVVVAPHGFDGLPREYPPSPDGRRVGFLAMRYAVREGQLTQLQEWFQRAGAKGFLAIPGLVSIDTYFDRTQDPPYFTVFSFDDEEALDRFQRDPQVGELGLTFDRFLGDHDHTPYTGVPPIYHVKSLSSP